MKSSGVVWRMEIVTFLSGGRRSAPVVNYTLGGWRPTDRAPPPDLSLSSTSFGHL